MNRTVLSENPNRREFLMQSGAVAAAAALSSPFLKTAAGAEADDGVKMKICMFSKHLHKFDYQRTAEIAAEVGYDGVDLTVRPDGHVLPERVKDDLPRAVEIIRKAGLDVPMIASGILDPNDKNTEPVIATAAGLGVRFYRTGVYRYDTDKPIPPQLDEIRLKLKDLAAINKQYNIHGSPQNHAGANYVGAAIWDLWLMLRDLDPTWMGCQYDIRHASVEGGSVWPTSFSLIYPFVKTIIFKDFKWVKGSNRWQAIHCPMGEGMTDFASYLKLIKQRGFAGPCTLHSEYLEKIPAGERSEKVIIDGLRHDLKVLKDLLRQAQL